MEQTDFSPRSEPLTWSSSQGNHAPTYTGGDGVHYSHLNGSTLPQFAEQSETAPVRGRRTTDDAKNVIERGTDFGLGAEPHTAFPLT